MFAKYKPFKYPTLNPPTEANRISMKYGVITPYVIPGSIGENIVWTIGSPTGNSAEPYRATDFEGYRHYSTPSILVSIPTEYYLNKETNTPVYIDIDENCSTYTSGSLKIKEIFGSQLNWYPGVVVYNRTYNATIWRTSSTTLSAWKDGSEVQIPVLSTWNVETVIEVYAVLSKYSYTGESSSTPPLEVNSMYYLEYKDNSGHRNVTIKNYNIVIEYITVSDVKVNFMKTIDINGESVYRVTSISGSMQNKYGYTINMTLSAEADDDDTGSVYNLGTTSISITSNSTKAFSIQSSEDLYASQNVYDISIHGVQTIGSGAELFRKKFNFQTNSWL